MGSNRRGWQITGTLERSEGSYTTIVGLRHGGADRQGRHIDLGRSEACQDIEDTEGRRRDLGALVHTQLCLLR